MASHSPQAHLLWRIHSWLDDASCMDPEAAKQLQTVTFPPPCFTVGMRFLYLKAVFGFHQKCLLLGFYYAMIHSTVFQKAWIFPHISHRIHCNLVQLTQRLYQEDSYIGVMSRAWLSRWQLATDPYIRSCWQRLLMQTAGLIAQLTAKLCRTPFQLSL